MNGGTAYTRPRGGGKRVKTLRLFIQRACDRAADRGTKKRKRNWTKLDENEGGSGRLKAIDPSLRTVSYALIRTLFCSKSNPDERLQGSCLFQRSWRLLPCQCLTSPVAASARQPCPQSRRYSLSRRQSTEMADDHLERQGGSRRVTSVQQICIHRILQKSPLGHFYDGYGVKQPFINSREIAPRLVARMAAIAAPLRCGLSLLWNNG
jgi:hypothetical protein